MKRLLPFMLMALIAMPCIFADEAAQNDNAVYPVAVLPFQDRSREVAGQGKITADILFANLATAPEILLVDREDLDTVLNEQAMNLSGVVNPAQAVQVGQIIGAKILVTGSVVQVEKTVYLVARIIGTETTQVFGVSVKGNVDDPLDKLIEQLAKDVSALIVKDGSKLVAKPLTRENRIAALKEKVGNKKTPVVMIDIPEEHLSRRVIDPAAETELTLYCTELGFTALDAKRGDKSKADILIVGEAFSERGMGIGNLISVKARVEVKAIDRASGRIIAIDRQTTVAVDVAETIAAKTALQQAGALLAERLIPKVVE